MPCSGYSHEIQFSFVDKVYCVYLKSFVNNCLFNGDHGKRRKNANVSNGSEALDDLLQGLLGIIYFFFVWGSLNSFSESKALPLLSSKFGIIC